jgi:CO dehydrogenase maturation factor
MQKISIAGKGGTGKSVLTTLLAKVLKEMDYRVLIVDADESNPGLYRMLGFHHAPSDLIDLFGGPRRVMELTGEMGVPTHPLDHEKIYLRDIPGKYLMATDTLQLASVGKITGAFEGCACPMAEVLKTFLYRLFLKEREIVLVDMEAGVEHFGRGVERYIDTLLILVEPSFESVALASKINLLAQVSGVRVIGGVINKITSPAIGHKMHEELGKRGIKVLGAIPYDEQIAQACLEGKVLEGGQAGESVRRIAGVLLGETPVPPPCDGVKERGD